MKHKLLYSLVALTSVGSVVGIGIYTHNTQQRNTKLQSSQTIHPQKSDPLLTSGTIKPTNQKQFESKNNSFEMKVDNNQKVTQGDLLAIETDDDPVKSAKKEEQDALISFNVAQSTGTQEDVQEAKKNLDRARYKSAATPSTETAYYAPFDGTVTYDSHTSDINSFNIASTDKYIESTISDFDYDKIKDNTPVTVKTNSNNKTTNETINFISSEGKTDGKFTKYEFNTSANSTYRLGQQVSINIKQSSLWIPKNAVTTTNKDTAHVRLETHHGEQIKTIYGKTYGNKFIVSSGLNETDKIKLTQ